MRGTLALLVCLVVVTAGCLGGATGPLHPPDGPADEAVPQPGGGDDSSGDGGDLGGGSAPGIEIPDYEFAEGTAGNVVVELRVRHNGTQRRTVRLVAGIAVDGGVEQSSKVVTLDPGERTFVGIQFDAAWDGFTQNLAFARAERT